MNKYTLINLAMRPIFCKIFKIICFSLLASLLVELGEYDISGPTESMSTREKGVK